MAFSTSSNILEFSVNGNLYLLHHLISVHNHNYIIFKISDLKTLKAQQPHNTESELRFSFTGGLASLFRGEQSCIIFSNVTINFSRSPNYSKSTHFYNTLSHRGFRNILCRKSGVLFLFSDISLPTLFKKKKSKVTLFIRWILIFPECLFSLKQQGICACSSQCLECSFS